MEGRPYRGRGGSWRRGGGGGGGGNEGGTSDHRGRGRGSRGRGKRDHYRGRGRGGAAASGFHNRDEASNLEVEEEEEEQVFTRRKLESNWDRYEESEKETQNDDEMPVQRGADFHVLLESAGDSFTQFRFSEEKEWEMDSLAASQFSGVFVDLPALAQCLQELPLHQRLNLEAELVQISTPVELPVMTAVPKQTLGSTGTLRPPNLAPKGSGSSLGLSSASPPVSGAAPLGSSSTATPLVEDMDEELDQLLCLQSPVSEPAGTSPGRAQEEKEKEEEEEEEMVRDKPTLEREEPVPEEVSAPPKAEPVKQDMTEEDLEDWLDSMIS